MPELINAKHERFAMLVARGATQTDALRAVGTKAKEPKSTASEIANRPEVKARIEELRAAVSDVQDAKRDALAVLAEEHDPGSLEWLLVKHRLNLALTEGDAGSVRESRATLIEIGKLGGHYVERTEVTSKTDALSELDGAQLAVLKLHIAAIAEARRKAIEGALVVDAVTVHVVEPLPPATSLPQPQALPAPGSDSG
jgi:hypothetical protein